MCAKKKRQRHSRHLAEQPGNSHRVDRGDLNMCYPPVNEHSYGKSQFLVDFPIKDCDFP